MENEYRKKMKSEMDTWSIQEFIGMIANLHGLKGYAICLELRA